MTKMGQQTVFVVDDDAAVRDSIAELLESVGLHVEAYASAPAFLEAFQPERPGCVVLDVRMPEMSGLVLQERLNALGISVPVIVLTGHGDVPMAVQAMKAGAIDFLQKPYRDQALLDSINAALSLDAITRSPRGEADTLDGRLAHLTEREREVLDHLLAGSTNREVGEALAISPRTAEVHRRNLLRKLEIGTIKELMLHMASPERGRRGP